MESLDLRDEFENILSEIINFLPNLLAAILILIIGVLVATAIGALVRKGLQKVRFDRAVLKSPAGGMVSRVVDSPASFSGKVVYWLILLGAISMAVAALNLPLLNDLLAAVYSYVPNIIAAILIFLVATTVSTAAVSFIHRVMGRTPMARLISTALPAVVMSLAVFMILNQLGIATDIVNILFTAIVGSVALGLALAFGLGGRDVAREMLEQAADNVRSHKDEIKSQARASTTRSSRIAKDL